MENIESILDELNDYDKQKTTEIPKSLEEYINHLAKTGETLFPWLKIRGVLRHKLELVIANFKEVCPTENLPPCPNVEPFHFETMRDKILEQFDSFTCAPFTIQRLCELLCAPRKHYKRTDKFMRGIEKNLLVVSTVDPEQRKRTESVSSQTLVNGVVEIGVGSNRPPVTFSPKNDQRPASAASDAASVSDADSGISDTEDEEKPASKEVTAPVKEVQVEQGEANENLGTPNTENTEASSSSSNAETNSAPTESQVTPPASLPDEQTSNNDAATETPAPVEKEGGPSGEENDKSIDVVSEEKPVEMEEEMKKTEVRITDADMKEEAEEVATPPVVSESPVSDKKRPLEKGMGGDEGDDSEHSPDAKQPRIFSPDKASEENCVQESTESSDSNNQAADKEQEVADATAAEGELATPIESQ